MACELVESGHCPFDKNSQKIPVLFLFNVVSAHQLPRGTPTVLGTVQRIQLPHHHLLAFEFEILPLKAKPYLSVCL